LIFATADKIRRAGFVAFEATGFTRIYAALTKDVRSVSVAAEAVTQALSGAVVVLTTLLFIAYLSPRAFVVVLLLLLAGLSRYIFGVSSMLTRLRDTRGDDSGGPHPARGQDPEDPARAVRAAGRGAVLKMQDGRFV
jgi:ABC-type siderophore export system fused ATPase/permease subunit